MISPLALLVALAGAAVPFDATTATELEYTGTLALASGREAEPEKRFTLTCLVTPDDADRRTLTYLLDERGGGGWAWPERFGAIRLDRGLQPVDARSIRLLHEHNDSPHPVAVRFPFFGETEERAEGASWRTGAWQYTVDGTERIAGRECWRIDVRGGLGRTERLWVEDGSSLVVAAEQRVVMGQGVEYVLALELQSARELTATERAATLGPLASLLELQQTLGRDPETTDPSLSTEQLQAASDALPALESRAEGTPLARLVAVIGRDVEAQSKRTAEIDKLEARLVGSKPAAWSLTTLTGQPVPGDEYAGKIVVLHFWDYRGEPLEEPYGQVGYLEYLHNRRRKLGVQVYGIALDARLGIAAEAPATVRAIGKLKQFMNLTYPVHGDTGTLVAKFGDPRTLGAPLPLWVVLTPDGTIAHYKVGYYDVDPNEGLRELDEVLVPLIRARAAEVESAP